MSRRIGVAQENLGDTEAKTNTAKKTEKRKETVDKQLPTGTGLSVTKIKSMLSAALKSTSEKLRTLGQAVIDAENTNSKQLTYSEKENEEILPFIIDRIIDTMTSGNIKLEEAKEIFFKYNNILKNNLKIKQDLAKLWEIFLSNYQQAA